MTDATANPNIRRSRRISLVWLVPILAVAIGAWMVYHDYQNQGPEVIIHFASADGLEAGKTQIRYRSIDVGQVKSVALNDTLDGVIVRASLSLDATPLLRDNTQFWVVKPRIETSGISGLGTLLSGAYIGLSPGDGSQGQRVFLGLEQPPPTPASTPGLHFNLVSKDGASLSSGDPILYRGYKVGKIESSAFNTDSRQLEAKVFIEAPYHTLVTQNTRFWNASGIQLNTSSNGLELRTDSLESVLLGGIAFDIPKGATAGAPASNGAVFELYDDQAAIDVLPFEHTAEYLLLFDSSVKGLSVGSAVEFRGLHIGTVTAVNVQDLPKEHWYRPDNRFAVPVRIRIAPGRFSGEDTLEALKATQDNLSQSIENGLQATLRSGNLLTGSSYVSLEFLETEAQAVPRTIAGFSVIPTAGSGLAQLEQKVNQVLDKVNQLPIEESLAQLNDSLAAAEIALKSVDTLLKDGELQRLPATFNESLEDMETTLDGYATDSVFYHDLTAAMSQLRSTMQNIDQFTNLIKNKPSELMYSAPRVDDPIPTRKQP